jgi:tetratricopeptide (TPR) repeat protein
LDSETDPATIPRPVAVAEPAARGDRAPIAEPTPTPAAIREALRSYEDISSDATELPGVASRRARSRWIAGVVLVGVVALFGATLGRRYMSGFAKAPAAASEAAPDGRVAGMLEAAARLLDQGDLEGAKEQLDKATVLGEKDPAVVSALARLETIRADVYWLKLRLLDPADQGLVADTNQQLGRRIGKAREAVDRATTVAATDPMVIRARIDLLRLARELPEARKLVGPLSQNASLPENAYVLAALDLAEQTPVWSSIIDRLRTASAAERELGRARAALIYALIRSGDVTQAKSELGKLESRSKSHQLLSDLESFVDRHSAPPDAGPDVKKEVATVDPSKLPLLESKGPDIEPRERPGDVRSKLKDAHAAFQRGDLPKAESLYRAVLAQHPKNTEALAGLGDIAKQRRDTATAGQMYEQALRDNPTYLPALIAQADHKWDSGDRKGAISLYRRVLEQAGASSDYGQRAAARIAQGEGSGKEPSEKPPSEKPPSEKPPSEKPPSEKPPSEKPPSEKPPSEKPPEKKPDESPHIDTTDLPEFNK